MEVKGANETLYHCDECNSDMPASAFEDTRDGICWDCLATSRVS